MAKKPAFSAVDLSSLSDDDELAFLEYAEGRLSEIINYDDDGDPIFSSVEHARIVLSKATRAFDLSDDIVDFFEASSAIRGHSEARTFVAHLEALIDAERLRASRIASKGVFESVSIRPEFKDEIRLRITKIKSIIDRSHLDVDKRDSLNSKLNIFLRELDNERTKLTAFTATFVQLSGMVGESAERMEPAIGVVERIAKLIGIGSYETRGLPGQEDMLKLPPPADDMMDN